MLRTFRRLALPLAAALLGATPAYAACGDGILEPATEECDDANLDSGDGCSSTCTIELPPGCTVVSQATYTADYGNSADFTAVQAYAVGLGYSTTFPYVVRCSGADPSVYIAISPSDTDPDHFGYFVTQAGLPEGALQTVFIHRVSETQVSMSAAGGALIFEDRPGFEYPQVTAISSEDGEPFDIISEMGRPGFCHELGAALFQCRIGKIYQNASVCIGGCVVGAGGGAFSLLTLPYAQAWRMASGLFGVGSLFFGTVSCAECGDLLRDCPNPKGRPCRTPLCFHGTCEFSDQLLTWYCDIPQNPPTCDSVCQVCDSVKGCIPNPAPPSSCGPCKTCQNGQCLAAQGVSTLGLKWARVSQATGNFSCAYQTLPKTWKCSATGAVGLKFYGCSDAGITPPHIGTCSKLLGPGWTLTSQNCDPKPPVCDVDVLQELAWGQVSGCVGMVQGSTCTGTNGCFSENGARKVQHVWSGLPLTNAPIDLRNDAEKEANCCAGSP